MNNTKNPESILAIACIATCDAIVTIREHQSRGKLTSYDVDAACNNARLMKQVFGTMRSQLEAIQSDIKNKYLSAEQAEAQLQDIIDAFLKEPKSHWPTNI